MDAQFSTFTLRNNILEELKINPERVKILEIGEHQILRIEFSVRPDIDYANIPLQERRPESIAYVIAIPELADKGIVLTYWETTGKFERLDPVRNSGEYKKFLIYLNRQKLQSLTLTNIHDAKLGGIPDMLTEISVKKNPGLLADFLPDLGLTGALAVFANQMTKRLKHNGRKATSTQQKNWFEIASIEFAERIKLERQRELEERTIEIGKNKDKNRNEDEDELIIEKVNIVRTLKEAIIGVTCLLKVIAEGKLDDVKIQNYIGILFRAKEGNFEKNEG